MGIGDRIKSIRKENDLTQEQFADILGIHLSHISHIERGTREPSKQLIKSIVHLFGLNSEWLISGLGTKYMPLDYEFKKQIARHGEQAVFSAIQEIFYDYKNLEQRNIGYINESTLLKGHTVTSHEGLSPDLEEMIKKIVALFGKEATVNAFTNFMRENGLAMAAGRSIFHANTGDSDLDFLINTLYNLWSTGDAKLKGWIETQFSIAFPPNVVAEILKKQKQSLEETSIG